MGVPSRKMFGTPTTRPKTKRKSLVKKAGRQKRLGKDLVQVTGRGTVKAPGSFRRHKFSGTTVVPRGSQVKFTRSGAMGGVSVRKGAMGRAGGSDSALERDMTSLFGPPSSKLTWAEVKRSTRVKSGEVKSGRTRKTKIKKTKK